MRGCPKFDCSSCVRTELFVRRSPKLNLIAPFQLIEDPHNPNIEYATWSSSSDRRIFQAMSVLCVSSKLTSTSFCHDDHGIHEAAWCVGEKNRASAKTHQVSCCTPKGVLWQEMVTDDRTFSWMSRTTGIRIYRLAAAPSKGTSSFCWRTRRQSNYPEYICLCYGSQNSFLI